MRIVDLPQKSEAWRQHRLAHWNASDAPAMMGCSPYETRTQLLHRIYCQRNGLPLPDVARETQRLFDDGHRTEALARPMVEDLTGEPLYPLVVANGKLSASLDGQTLMADFDWECKRLNDRLRAAIPAGGIIGSQHGARLPMDYRVQIAHQQHCSGVPRTLFTAAAFDAEVALVDARHCWVQRDEALIAQVLAGWLQFEEDLAVYVPPDAASAVVAAPMDSLPAVSVRMDGALAVISNLPAFGEALRAFVGRIPERPSTDQEFANTEAACKALKRAEEALQAAEANALASIGDVESMRRMVKDYFDLSRTTRLAREKMVAARKLEIKTEIVQAGQAALAAHIAALNRRFAPAMYLTGVAADFAGVIKGLKSFDSARNAVDTELARAKIEANATADRIEANLRTLREAGHWSLFADHHALVLKDCDAVTAIAAQRIAEHKAAEERRLEAERERIRAEERARADAEARRAEEARQADQRRQEAAAAEAQRQANAAMEAAQRRQEAAATTAADLLPRAPSSAAETIATQAATNPWPPNHPTRPTASPVMAMPKHEPAALQADEPATLSLGDICDRLGGGDGRRIGLSAAFLADVLHVTPSGMSPRKTPLYTERQFGVICSQIASHVSAMAVLYAGEPAARYMALVKAAADGVAMQPQPHVIVGWVNPAPHAEPPSVPSPSTTVLLGA